MVDLKTYIIEAWQMTTSWEILAVLFAIAYLLLVIRESIWCWPAALASTAIYIFLFFDVNLYMESALQLFYIAMAIYGWVIWRKHDGNQQDSNKDNQNESNANLTISSWSTKQHITALSVIGLLVVISGLLLEQNTNAAYPWLDSFSTWGAVVTTWMVTRKILENWIYWIVIDSVGVFLFIQRDLYLTALLFIFYVILCFQGYKKWNEQYLKG